MKHKEIEIDLSIEFRRFKKVFALSFLENNFGWDGVKIIGVNKITDYFNEDNGFDKDDMVNINTMQVGQTVNSEDISGYPLITRLK